MPNGTSNEPTPSLPLRLLTRAVRVGIIPRGYSWIVRNSPASVWGGERVRVPTAVGPMVVPLSDVAGHPLIFRGCYPHEAHDHALISSVVRDAKVLFDVGAHYGWYARLFAAKAPAARIYAFESNPRTFDVLRVNAAENGRITCVGAGVGGSTGRGTVWQAASSDLSSTTRAVGQGVAIEMVSLDDFCEREGIVDVDFVKCDVEGGELDVLRGARRILEGERPPIWMLEFVDRFFSETSHTIDEILQEFSHARAPHVMFSHNAARQLVRIPHPSRRESSNVYFVPETRLQAFLAASRSGTSQDVEPCAE